MVEGKFQLDYNFIPKLGNSLRAFPNPKLTCFKCFHCYIHVVKCSKTHAYGPMNICTPHSSIRPALGVKYR